MHTRKEIRSLSPEELLALRRAMAELQRQVGAQSFIDLAGYHGIPRWHCPHGSPLFLPWHRVYIKVFELALQSIDPAVGLPFWDWTSRTSLTAGMATAHSDPTYHDNGASPENPLQAGPIEDRRRSTRRVPPHRLERLRSYALAVARAMERDTYIDFNDWLEGPHGSVHTWVGGTGGDMSSLERSAFDPIFWSHHATIDRQWAIWQKCHQDRLPPDNLLPQALPGFPEWSVSDTLDVLSTRLDYTYEGLDQVVCPPRARPDAEGIVPFRVAVELLPPRASRILVEIHDVERDGESFTVDLFLRGEAGAATFAGSFGILGAGVLDESRHGHHHGLRTVQRVDITDAVDSLGLRDTALDLQLRAVNRLGDEIEAAALPIGALNVRVAR